MFIDAFTKLADALAVSTATTTLFTNVVDLSAIQNTMSLGIAVLVAAQGLALIHETKLALAAVSPGVRQLLAMTGADKVMKIFDTVEDAISSMRQDPGPQ